MQIVMSIICKFFESNNKYITQDSKLFLLFLHISLFFIIPLYCHLPSIMQIAEGTRIGQVYSYCLLLFSVMSGVFKINESFYCCVAGIVFFFFRNFLLGLFLIQELHECNKTCIYLL